MVAFIVFLALVLKPNMPVIITLEMLPNYKPYCNDELCIILVLVVACRCIGNMPLLEAIMLSLDNG